MNFDPSAWPGLSSTMQQAAAAIYAYENADPNRFFVRPYTYYHRVDYATTGHTALNLFNVAPAPFTCNLPVQGTIQNETAFRVDCIRVKPITGMTTAGARAANGAQIAATANPTTVAEELRTIIENGALTIKIGDKLLVENVLGLEKFPAGGGVALNAALANTNTSTVNQALQFNNGAPDTANGYWLRPGFMLLPGKPITGQLTWQAALTVTTAFQIRVELCGLLVSPANN